MEVRPTKAVFSGENRGAQLGTNYGHVDNHFHPAAAERDNFEYVKPFGLCLGQAPYIDAQMFVGREEELASIAEVLLPHGESTEQRRLVLGGTGGVGKTQLAIAYAKRCHDLYGSIFWLNAATKASLEASFQLISEHIFDVRDYQAYDSRQILVHIKQWLSHRENQRWLLIFDNYDEPDTYDIEDYYPLATHGSIIVTTRLPEQVSGRPVLLRQLRDIEQSLKILETRSQRQNVNEDPYARRLAQRLDGFPLALATAGAYLRKSTSTFEQYFQDYDQRWGSNAHQPIELQEYRDRTLRTTWDISYRRLEGKSPDAARLLKLLAYFDHQAIWYELLHAGAQGEVPGWLKTATSDSAHFEDTMSVLVDYCFVEPKPAIQAYSIHTCVHDWTLAILNRSIDSDSYWYALNCIYELVKNNDFNSLATREFSRLVPHAMRSTHKSFDETGQHIRAGYLLHTVYTAELLSVNSQFTMAEGVYLRAYNGYEQAYGIDHPKTLDIVNNLGILYSAQGKLVEAEQMYTRALAGYEQALGKDHPKTLDIVNNLGVLYKDQGKLVEAEQMYTRVLAGREQALGKDHPETLDIVNNLGVLYSAQGKLVEAEQMFTRALAGYEKAALVDSIPALNAFYNLGTLYRHQGETGKARRMLQQAALGWERALGPQHPDSVLAAAVLRELDSKIETDEEPDIEANIELPLKQSRWKRWKRRWPRILGRENLKQQSS